MSAFIINSHFNSVMQNNSHGMQNSILHPEIHAEKELASKQEAKRRLEKRFKNTGVPIRSGRGEFLVPCSRMIPAAARELDGGGS